MFASLICDYFTTNLNVNVEDNSLDLKLSCRVRTSFVKRVLMKAWTVASVRNGGEFTSHMFGEAAAKET